MSIPFVFLGIAILVAFLFVAAIVFGIAFSIKNRNGVASMVLFGFFLITTFSIGSFLFLVTQREQTTTLNFTYDDRVESAVSLETKAFLDNHDEVIKEESRVRDLEDLTEAKKVLEQFNERLKTLQEKIDTDEEQSGEIEISEELLEQRRQEKKKEYAAVLKGKENLDARIKEASRKLEEKSNEKKDSHSVAKSVHPQWLQTEPVVERKHLGSFLANPPAMPQRFLISSGRFATISEAEHDAQEMLKEILAVSMASRTGQGSVAVTSEMLRIATLNNYIENVEVNILGNPSTLMHRGHLLVDLRPENVQPLIPKIRAALVNLRIIIAAAALFAVMVIAGSLSFIFARTPQTPRK